MKTTPLPTFNNSFTFIAPIIYTKTLHIVIKPVYVIFLLPKQLLKDKKKTYKHFNGVEVPEQTKFVLLKKYTNVIIVK